MARSNVKSRSDHDMAHLHPLTNVPTKYQFPIPYGFRDIARTRFSNSRSLQGQRSNQGHFVQLFKNENTYSPTNYFLKTIPQFYPCYKLIDTLLS